MHSNNNYANSCGQIENFFSISQLEKIVQTFNRVQPVIGDGNNCFGINQKHLAYPWLKSSLLRPIAEQFNPDLKLIFGMLLDCVVPFTIHNDIKEIPEKNGKHFLSFLIPYSVNNDTSLCSKVSTVIFNESFPHAHAVENNVSNLHENLINHISKEMSYKITLKEKLTWSLGGLYWWDSHLLHVSNNFLKDGYSSKQAIVIHTYVL